MPSPLLSIDDSLVNPKIVDYLQELFVAKKIPTDKPLRILNIGCGNDEEAIATSVALARHCKPNSLIFAFDPYAELTPRVYLVNNSVISHAKVDCLRLMETEAALDYETVDLILFRHPDFVNPEYDNASSNILDLIIPNLMKKSGVTHISCFEEPDIAEVESIAVRLTRKYNSLKSTFAEFKDLGLSKRHPYKQKLYTADTNEFLYQLPQDVYTWIWKFTSLNKEQTEELAKITELVESYEEEPSAILDLSHNLRYTAYFGNVDELELAMAMGHGIWYAEGQQKEFVNTKDLTPSRGFSALDFALLSDNDRARKVALLLSLGADPFQKTNLVEGYNAIDLATIDPSRRDPAVLNSLLEHITNNRDPYKRYVHAIRANPSSMVRIAAAEADIDVLKLLVAIGVDLNTPDNWHKTTVLDVAKNDETRDFLRANGAETSAKLSGPTISAAAASEMAGQPRRADYAEVIGLFSTEQPSHSRARASDVERVATSAELTRSSAVFDTTKKRS